MEYRVCLLFMMTHFFCDFVIQSNKILQLRFSRGAKKVFLKSSIKGNLYHSMVHFIFMLVAIAGVCFNSELQVKSALLMAVIITIFHFIIDEIKSVIGYSKQNLKDNVYVFICDQLIHMVSILVIVSEFKISKVFNLVKYIGNEYPKNLEFLDRLVIGIIIFIICTQGIGIFIKKFMIYGEIKDYSNITEKEIILKKPQDENLGAKNGGFVIGILERIFILLVVAIGQPTMVGFVLTAKSIARFKKLDDNSFAEYFIIGTFISFIGAIIGGLIIKSLNIFPLIK